MSVESKLEEFLNQGASSAYSGGQKVRELIGEGKSYLIANYLEQTRNYGDYERVRGIVDVVFEMGRQDLLEDIPTLYTETNASLETVNTFENVDRAELFIHLSKGTYQIELLINVKNAKDYSDHYNVEVYHHTGNMLKNGWGYGYDDQMVFSVGDLEEGICRLDIFTIANKGTISEIKVSPWVR